jgi:hypothetical protein
MAPSETVKMLTGGQEQNTTGGFASITDFPTDLTHNLPIVAKKWLTKYGITDNEIDAYGIKYSASRKRLILPTYDDIGVLLRWEERALDPNQEPKYISYKVARKNNHLEIVNGAAVAVVEDYISAIKVGRVMSVYCLHGSSLNNNDINQLRPYDLIHIWLDDDKYKDMWKIVNRLRTFNLDAKLVSTALDPKGYHTEEIDDIIEAGYYR